MSKTKELFWTFFKIGAFTFGGGYAMVALLQNEFVEEKKVGDKRRISGHGGHCGVYARPGGGEQCHLYRLQDRGCGRCGSVHGGGVFRPSRSFI